MSDYMAEAFAPAEAQYRQEVLTNTWGHLAPKKNRTYLGSILFAVGCYGDIVVIRSEFDGLDSSPWYFDAEQEFVSGLVEKHAIEEGEMARFDGHFRNYRFVGKFKKVVVA